MAAEGKACWFVGAAYGGREDQSSRFIEERIWENGYEDRYLELVKAIQPGDRIAIKAAYTRKTGLPFDNRDQTVSVMSIKAVGTVTENLRDGRHLKVDWIPVEPPREWYFYTGRTTVWRVLPGDWRADALIAFTFEGKPQDIDRFRNAPYWKERFGDRDSEDPRFLWTRFYEAVTDELPVSVDYEWVMQAIKRITAALPEGNLLRNMYFPPFASPFHILTLFNLPQGHAARTAAAVSVARYFHIDRSVPDSFDEIPTAEFEEDEAPPIREPRKFAERLWELFGAAIRFADTDESEGEARTAFIAAYDEVCHFFGKNDYTLTIDLYWARPWSYLPLNRKNRTYIRQVLGIQLPDALTGESYLELIETLENRFQDDSFPVHSFPELTRAAFLSDATAQQTVSKGVKTENIAAPIVPYSLDDIIADGCFLKREKLEEMLERLQQRKNLILQGPPGTGKTWLAKRLASALIGQKSDRRVRAVQFHPNLSYEDFVRGWRPCGEGKLTLTDGPFLQIVQEACRDSQNKYVLVIEEINRGNPAQVFGEMLTLLEADKRTPTEALELCYQKDPRNPERTYIPPNLYVIGTMNLADRSLAMVDLALRRRFAFETLEPLLEEPWRNWVREKCRFDAALLDRIEQRITQLNETIRKDATLGKQFRIGHSYVTPAAYPPIDDPERWFRQVVETEIGPLLEEYWFDTPAQADECRRQLLEGF